MISRVASQLKIRGNIRKSQSLIPDQVHLNVDSPFNIVLSEGGGNITKRLHKIAKGGGVMLHWKSTSEYNNIDKESMKGKTFACENWIIAENVHVSAKIQIKIFRYVSTSRFHKITDKLTDWHLAQLEIPYQFFSCLKTYLPKIWRHEMKNKNKKIQ